MNDAGIKTLEEFAQMDRAIEADRHGIGGNLPPPTAIILAEKYASLVDALEPIAELADDVPAVLASDADDARVADLMRELRKQRDALEEAREKENRPLLDAKRDTDAFFAGPGARIKAMMEMLQRRGDAYKQKVRADKLREAEAAAAAAKAKEAEERRAAEAALAERNKDLAVAHADAATAAATQAEQHEAVTKASPAELTRTRSASGAVSTAAPKWTFEVENWSLVDLNQFRAFIPRKVIETAIAAHVKVNKDASPLAGIRIFQDVKASYR